MYKVAFSFPNGSRTRLVEGYRTARRAREVVERTNSTTDKHGVTAEYLGKDKA